MGVFTAIAGGLQIIGAIASIFAGKDAKDDAKAQGAEEARQEGLVTDERLRQLGKEEEALTGTTIAAAAGSGVNVGTGSVLSILAEQASEFAFERLITKNVGASKAKLALDRGRSVGSRAQSQSYANAIQGIGNAFQILGGG